MTRLSSPRPVEGRRLLEADLKKTGVDVPEMIAALKCSMPTANKWAFGGLGAAACLSVLVTLLLRVLLDGVSPIIAISLFSINVLLSVYGYFVVAVRAGVSLGGKWYLSQFNATSGLSLPGSGWISIDESSIYIWEYRLWWPSLELREKVTRESSGWLITNVEALGNGCLFDLNVTGDVKIRLRAGSEPDLNRMAEALRAKCGKADLE